MTGGASSVLLCKLFASGTVTGKPFRLFDVTMEIARGKFHLEYNLKIDYTKKSYLRTTNDLLEAKSSSAATAIVF